MWVTPRTLKPIFQNLHQISISILPSEAQIDGTHALKIEEFKMLLNRACLDLKLCLKKKSLMFDKLLYPYAGTPDLILYMSDFQNCGGK